LILRQGKLNATDARCFVKSMKLELRAEDAYCEGI